MGWAVWLSSGAEASAREALSQRELSTGCKREVFPTAYTGEMMLAWEESTVTGGSCTPRLLTQKPSASALSHFALSCVYPQEALAVLLHLQSTAELTAGNRNKENAEFLLVQRI